MSAEEKDELTKQHRHYRTSLLNKVFAATAVGLLLSLVWSIWDDYDREWKNLQRDFHEIELGRMQQDIDKSQGEIDAGRLAQLEQQMAQSEEAVAQASERIAAIDAELDGMSADIYLADQNFRFTKALLDTAKFEYEDASNHHPSRLETAEARLNELQDLLAEYDDANKTITATATGLRDERRQLTADLDTVNDEITELNRETNRLRRGLEQMDQPFARAVLNAPMLDFVNPTLKIQQIVLDGIENDINYMRVPRVDRCQTCHVAIDRPEYVGYQTLAEVDGQVVQQDLDPVFHPHKNLDLIGSSSSPHPFNQIGCTICHFGRDRGTGFTEAAHTPDSEEEAHRWEEEHHWHRMHHWDWPMTKRRYAEAGCLQCHMQDVFIPGAEKLSKGKRLFERLGCHGCHKVAGWEDLRQVGPPLDSIATKTDKDWVTHWLVKPRAFRPTTRMPQFWYLDNSDDPEEHARNVVEIEGVVEYLFERSADGAYPAPPRRGDPAAGKELVRNSGCHGCHSAIGPAVEHAGADPRPHGPNLMRLGEKTSPGWIYQWVRNPKNYWPDTAMPDLRLTEKEAADVTSYLASLRDPGWTSATEPLLNVPAAQKAEVRDDMVRRYLQHRLTRAQADEQVAAMNERDKVLMVGERSIARYGCFGCHVIPGFEDAQRIGTELTKEGSKYVDRFDFGFVDIPHERDAWLFQKLKNTRIFDRGKLRGPDELLKMPDFYLTDEEAESLVTVLLGLRTEEVDPHRKKTYDGRQAAIQAGWRIVEDYNCTGCHLVEERGGDIKDWIVKVKGEQGMGAADAASFAPPNLHTEGAKVQSDWLFGFIKNVSPIRPWLDVRMPSFHFPDDKVNIITRFFAALEEAEYPFLDYTHGFGLTGGRAVDADKLASVDYLNCLSCHQFGDRKPRTPPESWAPDLALARNRLREDWIKDWLWDPAVIMPGTRMPSFFLDANSGPPDILDGDEAAQVDILARWVMSLGERRPTPAVPLYTPPPPVPLVGAGSSGSASATRSAGGGR